MLIRPRSPLDAAPSRPPLADPDDAILLALRSPTDLDALASDDPRVRNRLRHRAVELSAHGLLEVEWRRFSSAPFAATGRERDNAAGEARERARHPEWYRFLEPSAPNHALKQLEAEIYLARIAPWLAGLGAASRVVDLGGGTGRLAIPLSARGFRVTLSDSNPAALADAARAVRDTSLDIEIGLGSAADSGRLASGSFDAALSVEVLCYLEDPLGAARELTRLIRPGGLAIVSVEAWPGGLLAVPELRADELAVALHDRTLHRPDDVFVRYFDREAIDQLIEDAGLEALEIVSHHHVLEGAWSGVLHEMDLARAEHRARIVALEETCSREGRLDSVGRAWLVVARKP